jgi:putative ABC transport system permease protein
MLRHLGILRQDAAHAWRVARRSPVFTAAVVLTLGLGIGANTAVFTVVDAVLLKPLSYPGSDRLVAIFLTEARRHETRGPTSPANYLDWKARSRTIVDMTAAYPWQPTLTGSGRPQPIHGLRASGSLFDLLGVAPALGRGFSEDDDRRDPHVVMLGHALWERSFGGDAGVVGRRITLDGERYTVVGVMPAGFRFPPFWAADAEFWAPIALTPEQAADRDSRFLRVFGRLRSGSDRAAARAELSAIGAALAAEHPADNAGTGVNVEALYEPAVSGGRPVILTFAAAAALVLLVVLVNVSNLLLSRASARRRELALRAALGAGRGRLLRQLLTESVLVGGAGGVAGVLVALWGVRALVAAAPAGLPRLDEIAPDPRVFGAALLVSLAAGLVFGLAPAWRAARAELRSALEDGARGGTEGRAPRRRDALVVVQVALAVAIAVGAGLLARSFVSLVTLDPGFASRHRLTADIGFAGTPFAEPARQPAFFRELVTRVEALPGVRRAGLVDLLPIGGDIWRWGLTIDGAPAPARGHEPSAALRVASPGYVEAMGLHLVRGRSFTPADRDVVLVNETFARRYLAGRDPVGRRLKLGGGPSDRPWLTVAGVYRDTRQWRLSADLQPEMYLPYAINPVAWWGRTTLVVETDVDPRTLASAVQAAVWAIDPDLPVDPIRTMGDILEGEVTGPRFAAALVGLFAILALVIAVVGVYAVLAYAVSRRQREMSVRLALGAPRAQIFRLVLGRGLALVAAGLAAGLALAAAGARYASSLLFGVTPGDPLTYAAVGVAVLVVAAAACAIPAWRATAADPMAALRAD